jgi:hypothetical protein
MVELDPNTGTVHEGEAGRGREAGNKGGSLDGASACRPQRRGLVARLPHGEAWAALDLPMRSNAEV